ncbi:MAG TPA: hypothetical protein VGJ00_02875 [Rhabdochlamydiaceae bacterium]|jgi:hypothetical protein
MICAVKGALFCRPLHKAYTSLRAYVQSIVEKIISKFFYFGNRPLPPALAEQRVQELIALKGAKLLHVVNANNEKVETLYIPSPRSTGNAVIFALNKRMQDLHPKNIETYLQRGADVVLFNFTKCNGRQYAEDLKEVIAALKQINPNQRLSIFTHCASGEPAIAAAAHFQDPNISLILDRTHGNTERLVQSNTVFAHLPCVREVLQRTFSCQGVQKLEQVPGKVMVLAPAQSKDDQVMQYGKCPVNNLTYDLFYKRMQMSRHAKGDEFVALENSDHWNRWSYITLNKVIDFLTKQGITASEHPPVTAAEFPIVPPQPPCLRWTVTQLNKSPFDC